MCLPAACSCRRLRQERCPLHLGDSNVAKRREWIPALDEITPLNPGAVSPHIRARKWRQSEDHLNRPDNTSAISTGSWRLGHCSKARWQDDWALSNRVIRGGRSGAPYLQSAREHLLPQGAIHNKPTRSREWRIVKGHHRGFWTGCPSCLKRTTSSCQPTIHW